jgi:hypothetical protein
MSQPYRYLYLLHYFAPRHSRQRQYNNLKPQTQQPTADLTIQPTQPTPSHPIASHRRLQRVRRKIRVSKLSRGIKIPRSTITIATMNDSYIQAPDVSQESDHSWSFTDIGKTRLLSRDFSSHSTDEVFNSVSHLSGAMLSLLGSTLLITGASARGEVWKIVAFSIYGACLSGMFFCSVLHHSINSTEKVSDGMIIDNLGC